MEYEMMQNQNPKTTEVVARHEACHIVVALALGFNASGNLDEDKKHHRVGRMTWDENDEAQDDEIIKVAIAAYVYELRYAGCPEDDCNIRSEDDMNDVNGILKKYNKSQGTTLRAKCFSDVSDILRDQKGKIDEIAADLLRGKHVAYTPEFLTMNPRTGHRPPRRIEETA